MNEQDSEQVPAPTPATAVAAKPNVTKWLIIAAVVLVAFAGLRSIFSPENIVERAIENQVGGDIDVDYDEDGTVTYEGRDGEQFSVTAGDGAELPDNWPSTVPVMDDAKITYAGSMMGGAGTMGLTAVFTTDASKKDVVEYYQAELAQNGWTIAGTMDFGDSAMVTATKGENESVGVSVAEDNGETTVTLSVGQ